MLDQTIAKYFKQGTGDESFMPGDVITAIYILPTFQQTEKLKFMHLSQ